MIRFFASTVVVFLTLLGCQLMPPFTYTAVPECESGVVLDHPASQSAQQALEAAVSADRGTGISAAVVIDGELVFAGATGTADTEVPLGPGAKMRTGSVAKLFTAVAAARLAEMGLLDLDASIASLVPETPDESITPNMLGTHTSGIRHYNFNRFSEGNNRDHYDSLTDALGMFADDPLESEPGTAFLYSSFGFNLLGVVVERVHGTSYDRALADLVAEPLQLFSLEIDDVHTDILCRPRFSSIAFGRTRIDAAWRDNSDLYPSGGLLVSAPDLAMFVDSVFRGGFVSPETLQLFTTETVLPDGTTTGYGFAWQIGRSEDGTVEWFGHGGHVNGAYASVRYYPASNMTIAGMTNYNYWLTSKRPQFFSTIREDFPNLFDS